MDQESYIKQAMRTRSPYISSTDTDLLHGVIGISTEAGELLDAIKKYMFYGRPLDTVNLKEELGDLFWYIALICNLYGWSFKEIQEANIRKLEARYPDYFTKKLASDRDLHKEREAL